jgi:hypothetical protein
VYRFDLTLSKTLLLLCTIFLQQKFTFTGNLAGKCYQDNNSREMLGKETFRLCCDRQSKELSTIFSQQKLRPIENILIAKNWRAI